MGVGRSGLWAPDSTKKYKNPVLKRERILNVHCSTVTTGGNPKLPEAGKRYPFLAEPPRIGHYREEPLGAKLKTGSTGGPSRSP